MKVSLKVLGCTYILVFACFAYAGSKNENNANAGGAKDHTGPIAPATMTRSEIITGLTSNGKWFKDDDYGLQCTNDRETVKQIFSQIYGIQNAVEESKDSKKWVALWRTKVDAIDVSKAGTKEVKRDVAFALTGDNPTKLGVLLKTRAAHVLDATFCLPHGFETGSSNALLVKISTHAVVTATPQANGTMDIATVTVQQDGSFTAAANLLAGNFALDKPGNENGKSILSVMGVAPVLSEEATE